MLIARNIVAAMILLAGIASSRNSLEAAEASANVLDGVRWVGPSVSLDGLRGKTVVLIDYATWCPICNKWSGEVCKQVKQVVVDKPMVVLFINTDQTPGNVRGYLEARDFFAANIVHGYDPGIAKRNDLPDLWGYMIIDPKGKIIEKGHAGGFFGGDANKEYVLPKKLQELSARGEFNLIDARMSETVKDALWPMELGFGAAPDFRKFKGEQKKQVESALAKYGTKAIKQVHKLAEGDAESQFAAYDRAGALGLQLKGTDSAKEARKVALALEADANFKRELAARKAYERYEKMSPDSPDRSTALKTLTKRFDGTLYGDRAKEAVASLGATAKAGK